MLYYVYFNYREAVRMDDLYAVLATRQKALLDFELAKSIRDKEDARIKLELQCAVQEAIINIALEKRKHD